MLFRYKNTEIPDFIQSVFPALLFHLSALTLPPLAYKPPSLLCRMTHILTFAHFYCTSSFVLHTLFLVLFLYMYSLLGSRSHCQQKAGARTIVRRFWKGPAHTATQNTPQRKHANSIHGKSSNCQTTSMTRRIIETTTLKAYRISCGQKITKDGSLDRASRVRAPFSSSFLQPGRGIHNRQRRALWLNLLPRHTTHTQAGRHNTKASPHVYLLWAHWHSPTHQIMEGQQGRRFTKRYTRYMHLQGSASSASLSWPTIIYP